MEALRWALNEARRRGATVEAVNVWHYPALTYVPGMYTAPVFAHDDFEAAARAGLDCAVDAVVADEEASGSGPLPGLVRVVLEGPAVERLVARSEHADLLVLGSRGHGGFRELLLGSVAHHCTAHAKCPVVIVKPQAH